MSSQSAICSRCGSDTPANAAFCAACGNSLQSSPWGPSPTTTGYAGYRPPYPASPPPGYQPYPPAMYQQHWAVPASRGWNGLAIASMVLGIVWIYGLGSILALIFGYIAKRQCQQRNENGRGMAIAGIVLGWVGLAGMVLLIVVIAIAAANSPGN